MSTAETLDAGQETPKGGEEKKSLGDYAGKMGETIKTASGKLLSVTGAIGLEAALTVVLFFVGVILMDFIGMGLIAGAAILLTTCLALSYVGNGLQGGTWNPMTFLGKQFA